MCFNMRAFLVIILSCSALLAVDAPNCYINNSPTVTGAGADTLRVQVRDNTGGNNGGLGYTVNAYIDNQAMTSLTDFQTGSSSSTVVFSIPSAAWTTTTGTINPKDGSHHFFWAKITNSGSFPAGVACTTGNGMPYTWNLANAVIDYLYPLYTSVSTTGATPANTAVIVNVSDTYSLGSAGATIYTVGGTAVKDDGVVGYYGNKYGIPSGHIHKLTMATTGSITAANMATAYATLTPVLGSDEQYIALGWMSPFRVTGLVATGTAGTATAANVMMSVASYFAYGGVTSFTSITGTGPILAQGQADTFNGMFLSNSTTPFTTYGQRPAFQIAGAICSSGCGTTMTGTWTADFASTKAWIDASFAARGTNPTAGKIIMTSSGNGADANYVNSSPLGYGTNTITPTNLNIVTSNTAVAATFSTTGILGYSFSASNVNTAATPAFQSGVGYGAAQASFTGVLDGSQNQTQPMYWLNQGAAFSCGSVVEPFSLFPQHYPDMFTMMSAYTRGKSAVEAAWNSMRDPATTVCVGDPLSRPFSPNAPGILFGNGVAVMGPLP